MMMLLLQSLTPRGGVTQHRLTLIQKCFRGRRSLFATRSDHAPKSSLRPYRRIFRSVRGWVVVGGMF